MKNRNSVILESNESTTCKTSSLSLLAIVFFSVFVVTVSGGTDNRLSSEQIHHRSMMREAIRVTMFRDPEVRENHIRENLKYHSGHDAQILRLLWLARESEPSLRKELLLQWLLEKEVVPEAGRVKGYVKALNACYGMAEISKRVFEVDEVFAVIESEREARSGLVKTIDDANQLILSILDENILLSDPNEPNSVAARRAIYTELPTPERIRRDPYVSTAILLSLWLIESDKALRDEFLWNRIEYVSGTGEHSVDLGAEYLTPLIKDMKESQKGARMVNLDSLRQ